MGTDHTIPFIGTATEHLILLIPLSVPTHSMLPVSTIMVVGTMALAIEISGIAGCLLEGIMLLLLTYILLRHVGLVPVPRLLLLLLLHVQLLGHR